jgi:hypothetical protein
MLACIGNGICLEGGQQELAMLQAGGKFFRYEKNVQTKADTGPSELVNATDNLNSNLFTCSVEFSVQENLRSNYAS